MTKKITIFEICQNPQMAFCTLHPWQPTLATLPPELIHRLLLELDPSDLVPLLRTSRAIRTAFSLSAHDGKFAQSHLKRFVGAITPAWSRLAAIPFRNLPPAYALAVFAWKGFSGKAFEAVTKDYDPERGRWRRPGRWDGGWMEDIMARMMASEVGARAGLRLFALEVVALLDSVKLARMVMARAMGRDARATVKVTKAQSGAEEWTEETDDAEIEKVPFPLPVLLRSLAVRSFKHCAASVLRFLFDHHSTSLSFGYRDDQGQTFLHHASTEGHAFLVHDLLRRASAADPPNSLDVDAADRRGHTPLHKAARNGHLDVVRALLDAGADVDARPIAGGWTPLHFAAAVGDTEVCAALIAAGAETRSRVRKGMLALHIAAGNGHTGVIDQLLTAGGDVNATNEGKPTRLLILTELKDGLTMLHIGAAYAMTPLIDFLVARGAHLDATDQQHKTALDVAAFLGNAGFVEALLRHGASVHGRDVNGWRPLHRAAWNGNAGVVKAILDAGADVKARTDGGGTALHFCACNGHVEAARVLLEAGAEVDAKDGFGETVVSLAEKMGHVEFLAALRPRQQGE
ncbi:hypothetical protein HDU96_000445 [Phlyctochytrium bullatum]|nr:hypothetical protein HDU96_000445 [Phlyctochytrium bullatum]